MRREDAIDQLFRLWQATQKDEVVQSQFVADALLEALCVMSPSQYRDEVLQAVEKGSCSLHLSPQQLREMLDAPAKGVQHVSNFASETDDATKLIEASVMFSSATLHPEKTRIDDRHRQLSPAKPPTTISVQRQHLPVVTIPAHVAVARSTKSAVCESSQSSVGGFTKERVVF